MKMERTECSETSAHKIQTPGSHPKERIQPCVCLTRLRVSVWWCHRRACARSVAWPSVRLFIQIYSVESYNYVWLKINL